MKQQQGFLLVSSLLFMLMMSWISFSLLQQARMDLLMTGSHLARVQQEHRLLQELREAREAPGQGSSDRLLAILPCRRGPQDMANCELWLLEVQGDSTRGDYQFQQTVLRELPAS